MCFCDGVVARYLCIQVFSRTDIGWNLTDSDRASPMQTEELLVAGVAGQWGAITGVFSGCAGSTVF